jgi:hypothetical protein
MLLVGLKVDGGRNQPFDCFGRFGRFGATAGLAEGACIG